MAAVLPNSERQAKQGEQRKPLQVIEHEAFFTGASNPRAAMAAGDTTVGSRPSLRKILCQVVVCRSTDIDFEA
jgi:hypothetical protein